MQIPDTLTRREKVSVLTLKIERYGKGSWRIEMKVKRERRELS